MWDVQGMSTTTPAKSGIGLPPAPPPKAKTPDVRTVLKDLQSLPALTPAHMDLIRRKVLALVAVNLESATEVLAGNLQWSTPQVVLFRTLLNKVLPDLSQNHTTVDVRHKRADQLTRAELEAIASGIYEATGTVLHEDGANSVGSIAYQPEQPVELAQSSRELRVVDVDTCDPPGGHAASPP
jgi:hypothetical protein